MQGAGTFFMGGFSSGSATLEAFDHPVNGLYVRWRSDYSRAIDRLAYAVFLAMLALLAPSWSASGREESARAARRGRPERETTKKRKLAECTSAGLLGLAEHLGKCGFLLDPQKARRRGLFQPNRCINAQGAYFVYAAEVMKLQPLRSIVCCFAKSG
jgi:hypothetical protein